MSYRTKDIGAESAPLYFYQFTQGSTVRRYVASAKEYTFQGEVWIPAALIQDKEFTSSGEPSRDTFEFKVAINHELAVSFLGYPLDVETSVSVFRTFEDELTSWLNIWSGVVRNTSVNGNVMTILCSPRLDRVLNTRGMRRILTVLCDHVHYERGCNLDPEDFKQVATVTEIRGSTIVVPSLLDTTGTGPYTRGFVKTADGVTRTIVKHSSMFFQLSRPIQSLVDDLAATPTGVDATFYLGCDRTYDVCHARFNNGGCYGGFKDKPSSNPYTVAII